jgi:HPt (histidine-containing phosphotransfer) domain-containing protein
LFEGVEAEFWQDGPVFYGWQSMYSLSGSIFARPSSVVVFSKAVLDDSTMGDPALQSEVIALFRQQFGRPLEFFGGINEAKEWRFAAHSLRGTAAALGALEVAGLAALLEQDGMPASGADRKSMIHAVDDAVARFLTEVAPFT